MRIDKPTGSFPLKDTTASDTTHPRTETTGEHASPTEASARRDSVRISPEARQLAEQQTARTERLAEIQQRIQDGFYSSDRVISHVAERLLASGEV